MTARKLEAPPAHLVLRRAFELPAARRRRLAAWEEWKRQNWDDEVLPAQGSDVTLPATVPPDTASPTPGHEGKGPAGAATAEASRAGDGYTDPFARDLALAVLSARRRARSLQSNLERQSKSRRRGEKRPPTMFMLYPDLGRLAYAIETAGVYAENGNHPSAADLEDARREVTDLDPLFEQAARKRDDLSKAPFRAHAVRTLRGLRLPLYLNGVDLREVSLSHEVLAGAFWDDRTRWPTPGVADWVRRESIEIRPGLYRVSGPPERAVERV